MVHAEHFSFTAIDSSLGAASSLPYVPLTLTNNGRSLAGASLLDTGATVNVLPYSTGVQLGAVWEQQTIPVRLSGNLAQVEARALIVSATLGNFAPVRLAFARTKVNDVPLVLGQINFFLEFDACFYHSQLLFEVSPNGRGRTQEEPDV